MRYRRKSLLWKAALVYSKQGYSVLPLAPSSKIPHKGSHGFKEATTIDEKVNDLWNKESSSNIGIATGAVSGLLIIDVDIKNGKDGTSGLNSLLGEHSLPITRKALTPSGGYHLYYKLPEGSFIPSRAGIAEGVDIRCDGGYIVAPPSRTPKGSYQWEDDSVLIATTPEWLLDILHKAKPITDEGDLQQDFSGVVVHEGERNDQVYKVSCKLRNQGTPKSIATSKVIQFAEQNCRPPLGESEALRCLDSAYSSPPSFALTDLGNAYRLQYLCSDRLKCHRGRWYSFQNGYWSSKGELHKLCTHEVIDMIGKEATSAVKTKRKKELIRHKTRSQSDTRLKAMLNIAASLPGFQMDEREFDDDDHLLGLRNGIYDLIKDVIHQPNPDLLVSKQNRISYDAEASSPKFEKFLEETFKDPELIKYVCKAVGYSLSGATDEQCLFILHGDGANGKSVFISILTALLGDYAIAASPEILVRRQRGSTNDIARLEGARLLTVSEESSNNTLDEALVKQLTGGDKIAARKLYQEHFEFQSKVKIWITANNLPKISDSDHGIWRRIRVIPFNNRVNPRQLNPNLTLELLEELPGVLNWALQGYRSWQREGLKSCKTVEDLSGRYRDKEDSFQAWFRNNIELSTECVSASDLYCSFDGYVERKCLKGISQRAFSHRLLTEGFSKKRTKDAIMYEGLKFKSLRRRRRRLN